MFGKEEVDCRHEVKARFFVSPDVGNASDMFPTAYAAGEVPDGEVPTEGVQSTETQPMETRPMDAQDEYAVSPLAVADKYAYLGNCDHMDIILSNGAPQGWHFADEDQKLLSGKLTQINFI